MWKRRKPPTGPVRKVSTAGQAVRKQQEVSWRQGSGRQPAIAVEHVPGLLGDGMLRPLAGRQLRRLRLEAHRGTTDLLQAIYPWMAGGGLSGLGQFVGHNVLGGGSFAHDPWTWYEAGIVTNPNGMVFGEIGSRKSTFIKTMIARGYEFGRDAFVTDVKDEYSDLAAFLGHDPVLLGPGLAARLNPFDPGPSWDSERETVTERQLAMLVALGTAVLDRPMTQSELTLCKIAIADVTDAAVDMDRADNGALAATLLPTRRLRVPVLWEVVDALMHPSERNVDRLPLDRGMLRDNTADLIMAFQRLIDGDLRGMFDAPTNIDVSASSRLIVINLSRVLEQRRQALPLVRICATAWLQSALTRRDGRRRLVIADEAWVDMTLGTLRWYQSMFKLTRQYLVSNWTVFHKPQDLLTAGSAGSERERLAVSLIADTGTVVLHRQNVQQLSMCRDYFGVNTAEEQVITHLRPGRALWKVGESRSFVVQHVRSPVEATFTDTDPPPADSAWQPHDVTDRTDAEPPDANLKAAACREVTDDPPAVDRATTGEQR